MENPELLQSMQDLNENNKVEKEAIPKSVKTEVVETPKPTTTVFVATNKQLETRLPSGKRRITPMLLTPTSAPAK